MKFAVLFLFLQGLNTIKIVVAQESITSSVCSESLLSGDYKKSENVCRSQLSEIKQPERSSDALNIYLSLTDIYHALGDSPEEEMYLQLVKQHELFLKDTSVQYRWHRKMGQKYHMQGQYLLARTHLVQGLDIAVSEGNSEWISKSYNDVGLVESKLGNYEVSMRHFKQSLELKRKEGNLYRVGTTLNNLGLIHVKLEEPDAAIQYYEQALDAFLNYTHQENFDKRVSHNISHLYEDLINIYTKTNQLQKADHYANEILNAFRLKFSAHEQARALINIAKLEIKRNNPLSSKTYLDEALILEPNYIDAYIELARVHQQLNDLPQAIADAEKGLSLAQSASYPKTIDFYKILSELYSSKDSAIAYRHLLQYQQMREDFLEKKYNSDLTTIQHQIEKQQIQHHLISEQLKNSQNQTKIQKLTTWTLLAFLVATLSLGFIFIYRYKKKQEHESLLKTIAFHKQQVLMIESENENPNDPGNTDHEQLFKEQIVKTLVAAVDVWERHTGTNKVEFAEKSKLWTVSIDNGTLRTRSLDKYLKLDKLPKNPRWRQVAKSCHFILSDPELSVEDREVLSGHLSKLMSIYEKLSLS